jgi:hypothetical protein
MMAGFKLEQVAGIRLEYVAGFAGIRSEGSRHQPKQRLL